MASNGRYVVTVLDEGLEKSLENLSRLLGPAGLATFMQVAVGPWLQKRAKERFSNEGDDASGAWAPLAPATVAIRESQQYPGEHPINRRTGELENWVTGGGGWAAIPHALGATLHYPARVPSGELGNKVKVAQTGGMAPRARNTTPPRPVLAVDTTDLLAVMTALAVEVDQAIVP